MEKEKNRLEKVTEDTLLGEIILNNKLHQILEKYNFPCLGCPLAAYELEKLKIGDIAKFYNIDNKKLIEELNEKIRINIKKTINILSSLEPYTKETLLYIQELVETIKKSYSRSGSYLHFKDKYCIFYMLKKKGGYEKKYFNLYHNEEEKIILL